MYVNRLIEFAELNETQLPALGYKYKKIDWIIDIEEREIRFTRINQEHAVPDLARSSNTKPILLVDKPDYVLGMYEKKKDKKRSEERHQAYKELLKTYIEKTSDHDVEQLLHHLGQSIVPPDGMKMGHIMMFRIRSEDLLHESKRMIDFWEEYVQPKKRDSSTVLPCMFCHKNLPVMERHTINFLIGPDRTKMISANKNAYESHGLKNSLSAPTCYVCEQKYGQALEYLLQRHKNNDEPGGPHMFRVGDMTYVYWIRGKKQLNKRMSLITSPTQKQTANDMKDLLNQAFKGISLERDINNFCLLALSSNKGRLVVRDYVEDAAGNIKQRIEAFFKAQKIENQRFYGIYTLAATMYKEPRKQMQKYALEEWMGWFLYGRPLSGRVLLSILKQIQSTGLMYPQHAAAVKSWLVSQNKGEDGEVKMENQRAYLTGRAFAILERIHSLAINSKTSIAARYFGAVSTTPQVIMGLLIRNSQNHLAKLKNDQRTVRLGRKLERDLGNILEQIIEFPPPLNLKKQGEFALGYYKEKQNQFKGTTKKEEKVNEL